MNTHFAVALHALALLHHQGGGPLTAVYIASSVGTNPVFLRRVLRDLQRAGLLDIKRGTDGGATLARSADRITLADVYQAVHAHEGLFSTHGGPSPACPVGRGITGALTSIVSDADTALRDHLRSRSLSDVLTEILDPTSDG